MAEEKEEIILDFKIDQGQALSDLEKSKRAITELRAEQAKLRKEYNTGKKDINEYAKESVKLERKLKEEQDAYRNLNKIVNTTSNSLNAQRQRLIELKRQRDQIDRSTKEGVRAFNELNNSIRELNDSIKEAEQTGGDFQRDVGNYPRTFEEAAKSINIAGVSVGDLTTKTSAFLNPATAALGVVTALAGAYAKSTTGSFDLAFAQNRLSFIFSQIAEDIGVLVGGESGRGGKGLMSQLLDNYLELIKLVPIIQGLDAVTGDSVSNYIDSLREESEAAANALERLRLLELDLVNEQALAKINEKISEDLRRVRDDEQETLAARLSASERIVSYMEAAGSGIIEVLREQIRLIKESTPNYENNIDAQLQVANLDREIADKQEEINGKLTENVTARRAILKLVQEQAEFERQEALNAGAPDVDIGAARPEGSVLVEQARIDAELQVSIQEGLNKRINKLREQQYYEDVRNKQRAEEQKRELERQTLAITASIIAQGSALAEEGSAVAKSLSITSALISTYLAATAALEPPPIGAGPLLGPALAAVTVATGLANVAKIAGFESGGYTGSGRDDEPAGIVHKNEVVWNSEDVSAVGGPGIANMMRPTARRRNSRSREYQDGGIVTAASTREINQQAITANMIKNMPAPVVGVKEFNKVARRVTVKENSTRA